MASFCLSVFLVTVTDIEWSRKIVNPAVLIAATKQSNVIMYDVRTRSGKGVLSQKLGDYTLNRLKLRSKEDLLVADGNANLWEYQYR